MTRRLLLVPFYSKWKKMNNDEKKQHRSGITLVGQSTGVKRLIPN